MPAELGLKPWALDYTPDINGVPDLPPRPVPAKSLKYLDSQWDPALVAGLAATEFATQFNTWKDVDSALDVNADLGWRDTATDPVGFITRELDLLAALMADDRDRYMPEIVGQADNAPLYWYQLLNLGAGEKPGTNALINFAQRAGEMLALHFKKRYSRVRPSTLFPGLLLPFGPPRHPAFPSGHSLTGHLTTYLLRAITPIDTSLGQELDWLADRVAKNRERAGLHYPSDSVAGQKLAKEVAKQLPVVGDGSIVSVTFKAIIMAAQNEW
jgi:hypothetical protein